MPEIKKYLSKDGLEDYNELLPHSTTQMQEYVSNWLNAHPEATTTVEDNSITTLKLKDSCVTTPKIADDSVTAAKLAQDVKAAISISSATNTLMGEPSESTWARRTSTGSGMARVESVQGATVVWNQLAEVNGSASSTIKNGLTFSVNTATGGVDVSGTFTGPITSDRNAYGQLKNINFVSGHKYFLGINDDRFALYAWTTGYNTGSTVVGSHIWTCTASGDYSTSILAANYNGTYTINKTLFFRCFDLTTMFGAGNEPTTAAEFEQMFPEAYYPYSAPTLKPVRIAGIKSVGFNQLDPANVRTDIFINNATGKITTGTGTQTVIVEVSPNTDYCLTYTGGNRCIIAGVDSLTPAVGDGVRIIFAVATRTSPKVFNSGDNRYIAAFIATSAAPASNICINISNPALNGQYKPHMSDSVEWTAQTLRAAGSVRDELTCDELATHVGVVVDASALRVNSFNATSHYITLFLPTLGANTISANPNITCIGFTAIPTLSDKHCYITSEGSLILFCDTSWATQADALTALSGVAIFYELATTNTTPIDPPLLMTYRVEQGGTESIIVPEGEISAVPMLTVAEGESAAELVMDTLACIATPDGPVATANHAVNTYLTYNGKLYKVTTAIATGETIAAGTNVTQTTVMDELIARTA